MRNFGYCCSDPNKNVTLWHGSLEASALQVFYWSRQWLFMHRFAVTSSTNMTIRVMRLQSIQYIIAPSEIIMRSHKSQDRLGMLQITSRILSGHLSPTSRVSNERQASYLTSNVHSLPEREHQTDIRGYCLKVLKRRNLAVFLMKCCQVCSENDIANLDTTVSLSFLFLKASTHVISQLSKYLATGHDNHIKIPEKQFNLFAKTNDFFQLQAQISKQMTFSKKYLNIMVGKLQASFGNLLEEREFLTEMREQQIQEKYFNAKIMAFVRQNLENERVHTLKKDQLNYLLLMSYIKDFGGYERLFEELINEETTDLGNQTLLVKVDHMSCSEIIDKLHSFFC